METVANIGCPDLLLSRGEGDEWYFCPISADSRLWIEDHMGNPVYQDRSIIVRGFAYVVELFDGLTDSGLIVR